MLLEMEDIMHLEGQSALVTGAGRGLGAAVARELARRGASVVLVARNRREVEAVAASIREGGGAAHALVFDVSSKDAIHPLVQAAAELAGPADLLVQCASTLGPLPMPLLFDTECEDFSRVLETNLMGPFRLAKAVGVGMLVRGGGTLVFVSSDAAVSPYPHWGAYGVSKAAQDHLVATLAAELSGSPIRVFSVDPGEMDTVMHAEAMPDADPATLLRPADVARVLVEAVEDPQGTPPGARFLAADRLARQGASS